MKLRFLISLLTLISLVIIFFVKPFSLNTENDLSKQSPQIQQAIGFILDTQSARRGENLDDLISAVSQHNSQAPSFYTEFIKGYIDSANNRYDDAKDHFDIAKQYIYPELASHVLSRLFYEISYIELEQKQYGRSENTYRRSEKLFNDNDDYSNAFILISLGRTYDLAHVEGGSTLSIKQANKTLEFAQNIKYPEIERVYFTLGLSYWNNNQTITGINFKLKALNIYIEKEQYSDIVFSLTDIGIDYLFLKNHNEAIRQLKQALKYQLKINNKPEEAYYIVYKLYSAYLQINDLDNAKYYLNETQRFLDSLKESIVKENFQTNQLLLEADYLATIGHSKEALALLNQANKRHQNGLSNGFYHFDVTLYNAYGKVYNRLKQYDKSIQQHQLALDSIKKRELFYLEDDTYFYLYEAYLKQKKPLHAISYLEKSHAIKTKQLNDNNQSQTQFLLHSFDNEKKEIRILELERNANRVTTFSIFLLCILGVIVVFIRILMGKNKEISTLNIKLHKLSITDVLTSIPNRRALELHLLENKQNLTVRSIMMIDIDYFKKYNDSYGHKKGDEALISVAKSLEKICQKDDFLARFGGEEFILIMDNKNKTESIEMAKHIQKNIASLQLPHKKSKVSSFITLSIGLSTHYINSCNNQNNEDAIIEADNALYFSKNNGRDQFIHYSDMKNN